MISQKDLVAIDYIVFKSGADQKFRTALKSDTRGRHASSDQSLFIAGMLMAVRIYNKAHISKIHHALTEDLPMQWQFDWKVRQTRRDAQGKPYVWTIGINDLQNISRSVLDRMNYSEKRLPDQIEPGDMAEERTRRYEMLIDLVDTLLIASLIPRPEGACDYALDGTGMWANERYAKTLPKAETLVKGDEDAELALGEEHAGAHSEGVETLEQVETPCVDEAVKTRKKGGLSDAAFGGKTSKGWKTEMYFGYEMHALVRAPEVTEPGKMRPEPPLAERIRLTPASTDVVNVSLELIDSVVSTGQKIRNLMSDRHYSFKQFDRWFRELLLRDINQVVDLRVDDQGFKEWNGVLIAAGQPHCTATPVHLGTICRPEKGASEADWKKFSQLISEREAYSTSMPSPLNADGSFRVGCPALAGTIGCPLRPGTVPAARQLGLPIVINPPASDEAPTICKQDSVGFKITQPKHASMMKVHQKTYWGSLKHLILNNRRTYVEGWFGMFKGDSSACKKRGSSMYIGLAHAHLEAVAFAVVANLIALRSWDKETGLGDPNHPFFQEVVQSYGYIRLSEQEYQDYALARENPAA